MHVPLYARAKLVVLVALGALAMVPARRAAADITLVGRYTFVTGDTATRTSYYSRKRVRVTAPDGKEFIHDTQNKRVTVIDHAKKRYYTGTIAEAESVATKILLARRAELRPRIEANQDKWQQLMRTFNDSVAVMQTDETRTIAGYPSTKWTMQCGSYMTHTRWVARGLSVPNYGPELEKVVMATVLDPMGRQLMKLLIQMRTQDGTTLASTTKFRTLTQEGEFSWETLAVKSDPIPASVWELPKDYEKVKPAAAQ